MTTFKFANPIKSLSEKKTLLRKKIRMWTGAAKVTTKVVRRAFNETLNKERVHKVYSYGFGIIARFTIVRPLVKRYFCYVYKKNATGVQKFCVSMIFGAGLYSIERQIGDFILSIFASVIDKKHNLDEDPTVATPEYPREVKNKFYVHVNDIKSVISDLEAIIEERGKVTVSEFYDLTHYVGEFDDCKYGWTDISDFGIQIHEDGFTLAFSDPKLLDISGQTKKSWIDEFAERLRYYGSNEEYIRKLVRENFGH